MHPGAEAAVLDAEYVTVRVAPAVRDPASRLLTGYWLVETGELLEVAVVEVVYEASLLVVTWCLKVRQVSVAGSRRFFHDEYH